MPPLIELNVEAKKPDPYKMLNTVDEIMEARKEGRYIVCYPKGHEGDLHYAEAVKPNKKYSEQQLANLLVGQQVVKHQSRYCYVYQMMKYIPALENRWKLHMYSSLTIEGLEKQIAVLKPLVKELKLLSIPGVIYLEEGEEPYV